MAHAEAAVVPPSSTPVPPFRPFISVLDVSAPLERAGSRAADAVARFVDAAGALAAAGGGNGGAPPVVSVLRRSDLLLTSLATLHPEGDAALHAATAAAGAAAAAAAPPAKGGKGAPAAPAAAAAAPTPSAAETFDAAAVARGLAPTAVAVALVDRVREDFGRHVYAAAKAEADRRAAAEAAAAAAAAPPPEAPPPSKGGKGAGAPAPAAKGGAAAPAAAPAGPAPPDPALVPALTLLSSRAGLDGSSAPTHLYFLVDGPVGVCEAAALLAHLAPGTRRVKAAHAPAQHTATTATDPAAAHAPAPDLAALLASLGWEEPAAVCVEVGAVIELTVPPLPPAAAAPAPAPAPPVDPKAKGGKPDPKAAAAAAAAAPASPAPPTPKEKFVAAVNLAWGALPPPPQPAHASDAGEASASASAAHAHTPTPPITGARLLSRVLSAFRYGEGDLSPAQLLPRVLGSAAAHAALAALSPAAASVSLPYAGVRDLSAPSAVSLEEETTVPTPAHTHAPAGAAELPATLPSCSAEGIAAALLPIIGRASSDAHAFGAWLSGVGASAPIPAVPVLPLDLLAASSSPAGDTAAAVIAAAARNYLSALAPVPAGAVGVGTVLFAAVEAVAAACVDVGLALDLAPDARVAAPTLPLFCTPLTVVEDPSSSGTLSSGRIGGMLPPKAIDLGSGGGDASSSSSSPSLVDPHSLEPSDACLALPLPRNSTELHVPRLRDAPVGALVPLSELVRRYEEDVSAAWAWFDASVRGASAVPSTSQSLVRIARAAAATGVGAEDVCLGSGVPVAVADRVVLASLLPRLPLAVAAVPAVGTGSHAGPSSSAGVVAGSAAPGHAAPSSSPPSSLPLSLSHLPRPAAVSTELAELCSISPVPRDVIARTLLLRSAEAVLQAADTSSAASYVSAFERRGMAGSECGDLFPWQLGGWKWAADADAYALAEMLLATGAGFGGARAGGRQGRSGRLLPSGVTAVAGSDPTSGAAIVALHTLTPRRRIDVHEGGAAGADIPPSLCARPTLAGWLASGGAAAPAPIAGILDSGSCAVDSSGAEGAAEEPSKSPSPSAAAPTSFTLFPSDASIVTVEGSAADAPAPGASVSVTREGAIFGIRAGAAAAAAPASPSSSSPAPVFVADFPGDGAPGSVGCAAPARVAVRMEPVVASAAAAGGKKGKSKKLAVQPAAAHALLSYTLADGLVVTASTDGWVQQSYGAGAPSGTLAAATAATGASPNALPYLPDGAAARIADLVHRHQDGIHLADGTAVVGGPARRSRSRGSTAAGVPGGGVTTDAPAPVAAPPTTTAAAGPAVPGGSLPMPCALGTPEPVCAAQFAPWPAWLPEESRTTTGPTGTVVRRLRFGVKHILRLDGSVSWVLPAEVAARVLASAFAAEQATPDQDGGSGSGSDGEGEEGGRVSPTAKIVLTNHDGTHQHPQHDEASGARGSGIEEEKKGETDGEGAVSGAVKGAPSPSPSLPAWLADVTAMRVDTLPDGTRTSRITLVDAGVSREVVLPLPAITVHSTTDVATGAPVTVRYDQCPVPDPRYTPPPARAPMPAPLFKRARDVLRVREAQGRVNAAHAAQRRALLGALWAGLEVDATGLHPIFDGNGTGPQLGRTATALVPPPDRSSSSYAVRLALHAEGTHILDAGASGRVVVACRGFATTEIDAEYERVCWGLARAQKDVSTGSTGPRTRSCTTLPDGAALAVDYDCAITTDVHSRVRLHRTDGSLVTALGDGRVQLRPGGVQAGPMPSAETIDASLSAAAQARMTTTAAARARSASGTGVRSVSPPRAGSRSASRGGRGVSPPGLPSRPGSPGATVAGATRGRSPTRAGGAQTTGAGVTSAAADSAALLGHEPHWDVLFAAAALATGRGLVPDSPQGAYDFFLSPSAAVAAAAHLVPTNATVPAVPLLMRARDTEANLFLVHYAGYGAAAAEAGASAASSSSVSVDVVLAGCTLPGGPGGSTIVPSRDPAATPLLTASVPGAPLGSSVVLPRLQSPRPPALFVFSLDGSGFRLLPPAEWEQSVRLARAGALPPAAFQTQAQREGGAATPPQAMALSGSLGGSGALLMRSVEPHPGSFGHWTSGEGSSAAPHEAAAVDAHGPGPLAQVFVAAPPAADPLLILPSRRALTGLALPVAYAADASGTGVLGQSEGRDGVWTVQSGWVIPRTSAGPRYTVKEVFGDKARLSPGAKRRLNATAGGANSSSSVSPPSSRPSSPFSATAATRAGRDSGSPPRMGGTAAGFSLTGAADFTLRPGSRTSSPPSATLHDTLGTPLSALAAALRARLLPHLLVTVPDILTPPYSVILPRSAGTAPLDPSSHPPFALPAIVPLPAPPAHMVTAWRTLRQVANLSRAERAALGADEAAWKAWRAERAARTGLFDYEDRRTAAQQEAEADAADAVTRTRAETSTARERRPSLLIKLKKAVSAASMIDQMRRDADSAASQQDAMRAAAEAAEFDAAERAARAYLRKQVLSNRGAYVPLGSVEARAVVRPAVAPAPTAAPAAAAASGGGLAGLFGGGRRAARAAAAPEPVPALSTWDANPSATGSLAGRGPTGTFVVEIKTMDGAPFLMRAPAAARPGKEGGGEDGNASGGEEAGGASPSARQWILPAPGTASTTTTLPVSTPLTVDAAVGAGGSRGLPLVPGEGTTIRSRPVSRLVYEVSVPAHSAQGLGPGPNDGAAAGPSSSAAAFSAESSVAGSGSIDVGGSADDFDGGMAALDAADAADEAEAAASHRGRPAGRPHVVAASASPDLSRPFVNPLTGKLYDEATQRRMRVAAVRKQEQEQARRTAAALEAKRKADVAAASAAASGGGGGGRTVAGGKGAAGAGSNSSAAGLSSIDAADATTSTASTSTMAGEPDGYGSGGSDGLGLRRAGGGGGKPPRRRAAPTLSANMMALELSEMGSVPDAGNSVPAPYEGEAGAGAEPPSSLEAEMARVAPGDLLSVLVEAGLPVGPSPAAPSYTGATGLDDGPFPVPGLSRVGARPSSRGNASSSSSSAILGAPIRTSLGGVGGGGAGGSGGGGGGSGIAFLSSEDISQQQQHSGHHVAGSAVAAAKRLSGTGATNGSGGRGALAGLPLTTSSSHSASVPTPVPAQPATLASGAAAATALGLQLSVNAEAGTGTADRSSSSAAAAATAAASSASSPSPASGVSLSHTAARLGLLQSGKTYAFDVTLTNHGAGLLRFRVDRAFAGAHKAPALGNSARIVCDTQPVAR
jgi:hypothetical protein